MYTQSQFKTKHYYLFLFSVYCFLVKKRRSTLQPIPKNINFFLLYCYNFKKFKHKYLMLIVF